MTARVHELSKAHHPWKWALTFDYSPAMVEAIKRDIPGTDRLWKPEVKEWWFKSSVEPIMLRLAERHCGGVVHVEKASDLAPELPAETVDAYRTLYLQPGAPDDLVKAAYRCLSKRHHPDAGGTTREMQRVNAAYEKLVHR